MYHFQRLLGQPHQQNGGALVTFYKEGCPGCGAGVDFARQGATPQPAFRRQSGAGNQRRTIIVAI